MTLELLLTIQSHDSEIDRIRYESTALPELEELAEFEGVRQGHIGKAQVLQERRDAIGAAQKKIESEVQTVRKRRESESERLYSGTVTAHKDLVAIQEELDMLKERQNGLEDLVLEQMELAEPVDDEIDAVNRDITACDIQIEEVKTRIAAARSELDVQIEEQQAKRETVASEVSEELLGIYEKARKAGGGLGVARLAQRRCMGCRIEIPAVKLQALRSADEGEIIYHDCGRILVR